MDEPELTRARLNNEIVQQCGGHNERVRAPLGEPGYRLPDIQDAEWKPMPGQGVNNWVLGRDLAQFRFDVGPGCSNNFVFIDQNATCFGTIVIRGSNNTAIIIGSYLGRNPINIHFHSSNHLFYFGHHSTSNSVTFEMGTNGTSIIVGEDCMFSAFIIATTDDQHGIFDVESKQHLNVAADILFEPHVWTGLRALILKGVTLGFGAIVGAGSVVTRNVPRKTAVAGSPAKAVRRNICWTRQRQPDPRSIADVERLEATLYERKQS